MILFIIIDKSTIKTETFFFPVIVDSQTKSSVLPSPITSLASQATSTEKQPPSNAQRRSDALLEQLTTPLRNPVGSVSSSQAQPATAVLSPGSKDSLESAKDGNNTQQASIDMKVGIN